VWYGETVEYDDDYYPEYLSSLGFSVSGTGTKPVDYKASEDTVGASYLLSITLGCIMLAALAVDLIRSVLPKGLLDKVPFILSLVTPGGLKAESSRKKAAFWKASRMVQNALAVHSDVTAKSSHHVASMNLSSSHVSLENDGKSQFQAILTFQSQSIEMEEVGGMFWTWKRVFDGSLFSEEGLWIHSRLLAINMAQVLVVRTG